MRLHGYLRVRKRCSIEGCEKPSLSRGWCGMHYYRWRRHGDPHVVKRGGWLGDSAGYRAVHSRLVAARGKASEYECVRCGNPALDWAFDEIAGYSHDLTRYYPLCRRCHQGQDGRRKR